MLPPVRAALSSTADYQSQAQVAIAPARATVPPNSSQSQPANDATLSGARLDTAALSGQLKLAQGSSIFAETIGKLLKIPRRENETLIDYTTRLFETVQALKPQEIANVERLLNQIVKGISLRLMAEILKEPSGPTAARLAAHIETANIAQRDLAAKTVVNFYRQNASADPPLNANASRVPQGGNAAVVSTNQTSQPRAAQAHDLISTTRQPTANDVPLKVAEVQTQRPAGSPASSTSAPPVSKPDQWAQPQKPAAGAAAQANMAASQNTSGRPSTVSNEAATATKPATSQIALQGSSQPGTERPDIIFGKPGAAATMIGNQAQAVASQAARQIATAEPKEVQALARTAMEMFKQDMPVPARLWSALSDQTLLKLANWLATILSELDAPQLGHLASSSPAAQALTDDKLADQQRATGNQNSPTSQNTPAAAPSQSTNGGTPEAARQAAVTSMRDAPEQHMAAMAGAAGALLPTQAREALPWPYVAAYPPADDEPRQEQRKAQPIEAIEDEEQDGSSQQHTSDDKQQPEGEELRDDHGEGEEMASDTMTKAEKAAGYRAGEARIEADTAESRPSDFYWRMAGWT